METITAAELKSNLYFLASDEMRGRGTNTPFNAITSRYLAHRFELDGLKTARDHSSYFQSFGLVQAQLSSPNRLEIQTADFPLAKMGLVQEDFYPSPITANGRVIGSVVFAGYGITAPEHSYDDYAGIDAKGKMVLVMLSEPGERDSDSPFEGAIQSEYGGALHKILNAQKHGAAEILLFRGQAKNFNQSIFPQEMRRVWPEEPKRAPYSLQIWADRVRIPAISLSPRMITVILEGIEPDLEEIYARIHKTYQPYSFEVRDVNISVETTVFHKKIQSRNILAYLADSQPTSQEEIVIVGAHFDHIGVQEGKIYNGADDDASGIAGFWKSPRPLHSVPKNPNVLFSSLPGTLKNLAFLARFTMSMNQTFR